MVLPKLGGMGKKPSKTENKQPKKKQNANVSESGAKLVRKDALFPEENNAGMKVKKDGTYLPTTHAVEGDDMPDLTIPTIDDLDIEAEALKYLPQWKNLRTEKD